MKVVYIEKEIDIGVSGQTQDFLYIPKLDVVLVKNGDSWFGKRFLTAGTGSSEEIKAVLGGKKSTISGIRYSEPVEFEYDGSDVQEMVEGIRKYRGLQKHLEKATKKITREIEKALQEKRMEID